MFKLMGITLITTSLLLAGCGGNDKKGNVFENYDPQNLTDEQKAELEQRKERSAQKGNGLDSFDPNKTEQTTKSRESNNVFDSFDPHTKE